MTTLQTASINASQCVTLPGYGYYDGAAMECDYGLYSSGCSQNECDYCGDGYNTSRNGSPDPANATTGADGPQDCVVAAGWTSDGLGGIKPCPQGWFKSQFGRGACVRCPHGTTSTTVMAAIAESDCDTWCVGLCVRFVSAVLHWPRHRGGPDPAHWWAWQLHLGTCPHQRGSCISMHMLLLCVRACVDVCL